MILLDTNVLGRLADASDPNCELAQKAVLSLRVQGEQLALVPQNLYEFWALATRPAGPPPSGRNGLGMAVEQASKWIEFFQRRFLLLFDREDILTRWHSLVRVMGLTGARSHDARIVAAMQSHGIERLLTFDGEHFRPFPVSVMGPASV